MENKVGVQDSISEAKYVPTYEQRVYRILVSDDEERICEIITRVLEDSDPKKYHVIPVSTGEETLRVYKESLEEGEDGIALIITDIKKRGSKIDGTQLCEAIRKYDTEIPIILFTGYYNVKKGQFTAVLQKPATPTEIKEIVEFYLQ